MREKNMKSKIAAVRREIRERIQSELDESKIKVKKRIKSEDISVEEKREKYRREVHEEKLRLMKLAKEEFIARRRMLGLNGEETEAESEEISSPSPHSQLHAEENVEQEDNLIEQFEISEGDDEIFKSGVYRSPEDSFIYTDEENAGELEKYVEPIDESDVSPMGMEPEQGVVIVGPEGKVEGTSESRGIFYHIINLVLHPLRALHEFDEYLSSPKGLFRAALFYFLSLSPVVLIIMVAEGITDLVPDGPLGSISASLVASQSGILIEMGQAIGELLIYSCIVAIINYFVKKKTNFLTLTVYFAFVEGVARLIVFMPILLAIAGAVAVVASPQTLTLIFAGAAILLFVFVIWRIALNIIVLMSAYEYEFLAAFLVIIGASIARWVFLRVILSKLGMAGL